MGRFLQSAWPVFFGVFFAAIVATWNLSRSWSEAESDSREKNLNANVTLARESLAIETDRVGDRIRDLLDRSFTVNVGQGDLYASEFEALALISGAEGGWRVDWLASRENQLSKEKISEELTRWPIESAKATDVIWTQYQATATQTLFVVVTELKTGAGEPKWGVGFLSTSYFAKFVAGLNSSDSQVMFVDSTGNLYAHPELKYVGTKFTAHPVIVTLTKSQSAFRLGEYKNTAGEEFLAGFAKVPKSNLFVAITTATKKAKDIFKARILQILLLSLAIAFVFSGLNYFLRDSAVEQVQLLQKNIELLRSGHAEPSVIKESSKATNTEASRISLVTALVRYMREPLNMVVGFMQMIDHEIKSSAGKEKLKKMEVELRRLNDFVGDLAAREKIQPSKQEVIGAPTLVSQVVSSFRKRMSDEKIQFEENMKTDSQLRGDFEEIKFSLKAIMALCVDRLGAVSGDKKIVFNIEKMGGVIRFEFNCIGASLNSEERKNVFRPFQIQLKEAQFHGLDLALAKTFIDTAHGDARIESMSNGFSCRLDFPTIQNQDLLPEKPIQTKSQIEALRATRTEAPPLFKADSKPPPVIKAYESKNVSEVLGRKPLKDADAQKLPPPPDFTQTDVQVATEVTLVTAPTPPREQKNKVPQEDGVKPKETRIRKPRVNT